MRTRPLWSSDDESEQRKEHLMKHQNPNQNDQNTKRDMPGKNTDQGQQHKQTGQGQDQTRKDSPQRDDRDAQNR